MAGRGLQLPGPPTDMTKMLRSRLALVGAAALLVCAMAVAGWWWHNHYVDRQAAQARHEVERHLAHAMECGQDASVSCTESAYAEQLQQAADKAAARAAAGGQFRQVWFRVADAQRAAASLHEVMLANKQSATRDECMLELAQHRAHATDAAMALAMADAGMLSRADRQAARGARERLLSPVQQECQLTRQAAVSVPAAAGGAAQR